MYSGNRIAALYVVATTTKKNIEKNNTLWIVKGKVDGQSAYTAQPYAQIKTYNTNNNNESSS